MKKGVKRLVWALVGALLFLVLLGFTLLSGLVDRSLNRTLDGASYPVGDLARSIHSGLDVADLHGDALLWDRNLLQRGEWGHVDLPRMQDGRMALQVFTTVTKTPRGMNIESNTGDSDNITLLAVFQRWPVRTWGNLTERVLHQADKLRSAAALSDGGLTVVSTRADLEGVLRRRASGSTEVAGILGIEGAHALEGDLANVDRLFEAGFRMFGLTHFFDNEVGASAHGQSMAGLTDLGRAVLDRMDELGILVDLAHASPALIDEVLSRTTRPVVVSHTGVRGTCDNQRNLDDGQLSAIAATGGVVGIGLWSTAVCGETPRDWARAVRHAADVAGVDHVGLGSDWDGAVAAIVDASQTVHLTQALVDEGFEEDAVRKIMGGNVIRLWLDALPEGENGP